MNLPITFDPKRDAYGFAVRPQHLQRYREYANIYQEEEDERSYKWKSFLEQRQGNSQLCSYEEETNQTLRAEATEQKAEAVSESAGEDGDLSGTTSGSDCVAESGHEKEVLVVKQTKNYNVQSWTHIKPSLGFIENMMSFRVKKRKLVMDDGMPIQNHLPSIEEVRPTRKTSEDDFEVVASDTDLSDDSANDYQEANTGDDGGISPESSFPWKQELEFLVHGGVPKDMRGEVWQAFVGVRTRRTESYYQHLLTSVTNSGDNEHDNLLSGNSDKPPKSNHVGIPEKSKRQIEKDLPRTFPGHPALDEDGRNALRRLLLAYALHNPYVGYCQAMNFFAGLLLLLMPEENAFWALVGLIDDYFDGYFTEDMIESQVDQLVFEDLMRERFPKLVNHLDYLGVQVAWISGPWFLSIFVNMLPWESVLRVWDVLLFEGNRVMLFRTALALMELYGPALVTTKDAGDVVTLLQSLTGSTFDSSQLVLTACMGFLAVTEERLQQLREKHRPAILEALEERSKVGRVWKDSKGLASKLYSFKHDPASLIKETTAEGLGDMSVSKEVPQSECRTTNLDDFLSGLTVDLEVDSVPDLQEQVVWLKVELCRMLEEKRAATLRSEELETALMEMVKQDNRRQLSARVEQLEQEVSELRQALVYNQEQENAMLQVLMRVEQEQRVTEDARVFAEQDAAAQRYAVQVLQEKYEKAMATITQMEKRVVMAESMLEATLQYQSGQVKAQTSPRAGNQGTTQEQQPPTRKLGILSRPFGLGWRDKNKGKPADEHHETKSSTEGVDPNAIP